MAANSIRAGGEVAALLQEGLIHHQTGRFETSAALYEQILARDPLHADALHLRGLIDFHFGDHDAAIARIEGAIAASSVDPRYFYNLGTVFLAKGDMGSAATQFGIAIEREPTNGKAHGNLAAARFGLGDLAGAIESYRRAVAIDPGDVGALSNLGATLRENEEFDEAIEVLKKALQLDPQRADTYNNFGIALLGLNRNSESIVFFDHTLELDPTHVTAMTNLGNALRLYRGPVRSDDTISCYRRAIVLQPTKPDAYFNLMMALQYADTPTPQDVFDAHLQFALQFETPLKPLWEPHGNAPLPERRLKIGYVSGDLRNHSVAYFIEPILSNHDRSRFEVVCYHNHKTHDQVSERLARHVDDWQTVIGLTDEQFGRRIRADGIDILIDLSGHTAFNRLLTFARRPAPVQITFNGYPATTGLSSMDYRISDGVLDPEGMTDRYHSETVLRIPSVLLYRPEPESPDINALPALTRPHFVFACLNNLVKITPRAIRVWAQILMRKPGSKLMLGNLGDENLRQRFIAMFADGGIDASRLILKPPMSLKAYLELHHEIDLGLDPFPYNGGTTSNHSMWMGVPLVTLAGRSAVSRCTTAVMTVAGLPQFIATSEEDYIERALELSDDLAGLDMIRRTMRSRLSTSTPDGHQETTRHFESALRAAWRNWCASR